MWAVLAEAVQQILEAKTEFAAEFIVDDRKDEEFRVEQPAGHAEQRGLPAAVRVDRVAADTEVVLDVESENPLGDYMEGVQNEVRH